MLLELDALEHDDAVAARQRRCHGLAARREDRCDDDQERYQHTDCGGVDERAAVHCLRCAFASGAASKAVRVAHALVVHVVVGGAMTGLTELILRQLRLPRTASCREIAGSAMQSSI